MIIKRLYLKLKVKQFFGNQQYLRRFFNYLLLALDNMGKGQNYENQNIEIQKEHQKCFKASEH